MHTFGAMPRDREKKIRENMIKKKESDEEKEKLLDNKLKNPVFKEFENEIKITKFIMSKAVCCFCRKYGNKNDMNFLFNKYSHKECDDKYFIRQEKMVKYVKKINNF